MPLCGAVVSRAQAPMTATTDRPNVPTTHRAKKSLWLVDEKKIGNFNMVASCDGRITHLTDGDTGSDSQWYERQFARVGGARRAYRKTGRETSVVRRDLADKLKPNLTSVRLGLISSGSHSPRKSLIRGVARIESRLLDLQASRSGRDDEMELASRTIVHGLCRPTVDQGSLRA